MNIRLPVSISSKVSIFKMFGNHNKGETSRTNYSWQCNLSVLNKCFRRKPDNVPVFVLDSVRNGWEFERVILSAFHQWLNSQMGIWKGHKGRLRWEKRPLTNLKPYFFQLWPFHPCRGLCKSNRRPPRSKIRPCRVFRFGDEFLCREDPCSNYFFLYPASQKVVRHCAKVKAFVFRKKER